MPTYQVDIRTWEKAEADVYKTVEVEAESEEEAERKAGRPNGGTVIKHEHNSTHIKGPEVSRDVTGRPHEV